MDPTRFDRLVRAFAGGNTRRRLVAVLTALPLAGALAGVTDDEAGAEKPRDRIKRRKDANRRRRRNRKHHRKNHGNSGNNQNQGGGGGGKGGEQPDACTANGGACQQNSDCCGDNCFNQACAATVSQCGGVDCPASATGCCTNGCCFAPANQCNAAGDCCSPNCTGKQCGPDGCGGTGTCGACTNVLQVCAEQTGQCVGDTCGPQSCPTGCCDDNDICQTGPGFGGCGRRAAPTHAVPAVATRTMSARRGRTSGAAERAPRSVAIARPLVSPACKGRVSAQPRPARTAAVIRSPGRRGASAGKLARSAAPVVKRASPVPRLRFARRAGAGVARRTLNAVTIVATPVRTGQSA